jgi:hypothetical protein
VTCRSTLALAAVLAVVGALGTGCGGGGTATQTSGAEELSMAIARYTGLPSAEADTVAGSVRSTSVEAVEALTRAVDEEPPLPSSASLETELKTLGRDQQLDADAALADLCEAIVDEPSPRPSIRLDPDSDELDVRWIGADPALQLGRFVHRASVRILDRKFDGPRYDAMFLEGFEDSVVEAATRGVPEHSDQNKVLLWLRLQQLRSGVCG